MHKFLKLEIKKIILFDTILLIVIPGASAYFGSYLRKKGENYATTEDIEKITKLAEEVKSEFKRTDNIKLKKFELLHDAILEALRLIDCYYSHKILPLENESVDLQHAETEEFRDCHNKLILSCKDPKIVALFLNIMLDKISVPDLMKKLDEFRGLARKELEFGNEIKLDEDKCWFANVICKSKS